TSRNYVCSAPSLQLRTIRRCGSAPGRAVAYMAPATLAPGGYVSTSRAIAVRVASRAPATRTYDWPGARAQRDLRADQRVHRQAGCRASAQGEGRGNRACRVA